MDKKEIFKFVKEHGRKSFQLTSFSNPNEAPTLACQFYEVNLKDYASELEKLKVGEIFLVGRPDDSGIALNVKLPKISTYSRIHFFVEKCESEYVVFDCSLKGTTISLGSRQANFEAFLQKKGIKKELVTEFTMNSAPSIRCYDVTIDLNEHGEKLLRMKDGDILLIGRSSDADIKLPLFCSYGKYHAVIFLKEKTFSLYNLHENGTYCKIN